LAAACFALGLCGRAEGAEIRAVKLDKGGTALLVTGDIQSGDGAKFRAEASKYDNGYVLLESNGGSLTDAIDIGETIHLKGWPTTVINGSSCNSACALIWLAGTPRALSRSGKIGFHAAYSDTAGSAQESGVGNAMVGRYLTLLNLPEKAIIFATSASPSQLQWLTSSNYASTGIDVVVIDDINLDDNSSASSKESPPPVIQTVTAPPSAAASSETSIWRRVGSWTVYIDHTLDEGCFLFASFDNHTLFRVGVNRASNGHYYVMFANPAWKSLQVGQKYDVQFQFGGNSPWDVPTTAKDMDGTIALMSNFEDSEFWKEFSNSDELNVTREGKRVTDLRLTGSKAAFDELVTCQKYQDSQTTSRDPFKQ
jgi:hypothetical protein